MGVYVDDLLCFGDDQLVEDVSKVLKSIYEISVMGPAKLFLSIHIDQSVPGQISIDQSHYIKEFLSTFHLDPHDVC
jgi:hypothetical protein